MARLQNHNKEFCSLVLDAGCDVVIIPNVKNAKELKSIRDMIYYPPKGKRGVGFSRENLFGKNFKKSLQKIKKPILVSMIESKSGITNIKKILKVKGLDAILIGPYDLSASLGITGKFESKKFKKTIEYIKQNCKKMKIPVGLHVLQNDFQRLNQYKKQGYTFLPYCTDAMLLNSSLRKAFKNK